jgi:FAD/FMN-containing dehydrogenase
MRTRTLVAEYTFPLGQALPVLRGWRDLNAEAPRQATFTASVRGDDLVTAGFVWAGDPERGRRLLPAMRALGRPVAEHVSEPSYVELQRRDDTVGRHALRRYSKGHYLRRLPDEAIEAFLLRGAAGGHHGNLPNAGLQAYGGVIADVPDEDTAFSHRDALFEFGTGTSWTDPAEDPARMAVARRCAAALEPFASGVYVNALSDEGAEGVRRAYPRGKLARLTALKNAYDPHNVFHLNHNIPPAP